MQLIAKEAEVFWKEHNPKKAVFVYDSLIFGRTHSVEERMI